MAADLLLGSQNCSNVFLRKRFPGSFEKYIAARNRLDQQQPGQLLNH